MRIHWRGFRGSDGVWGGDLVDRSAPWAMREKISHLILGALVYLLAARWMVMPWLATGVVAVGVEVIEAIRYTRYGWTRSLSDEPDIADVVATMAGAVLAWAVL